MSCSEHGIPGIPKACRLETGVIPFLVASSHAENDSSEEDPAVKSCRAGSTLTLADSDFGLVGKDRAFSEQVRASRCPHRPGLF